MLKIKHLLRELSGIIARWEMKKMLGAAAVIFGLATTPMQGQSFAEPVTNPFSLSSDALLVVSTLADLDGDGDFDLLASEYNYDYATSTATANFVYYENIGTASEPSFGMAQDSPFGLDLQVEDYGIFLATVDLDDDGDFDVFATGTKNNGGVLSPFINYYENIGTASNPSFTEQSNIFPELATLNDQYYIAPSFGDLDGDGDLDLVVGVKDGDYSDNFFYLENVGTASMPEFASPQANALGLVFSPSTEVFLAIPTMADLDLDGDMDLLCVISGYYNNNGNEYDNGMFYFENTGNTTNPQFVVSERNPLDITIPSTADGIMVPALGDIDDDGDIDMLGASLGGNFYFYENTDNPVSTTTLQADFPVNIFPNPTNNYLNINTNEGLSRIEIYDLFGRQLATYDGQQTQIPLQDLSNGTYMIRLINQEGEYLSKRIEKL